ncbi:4-hydroxy-tetrahydrodipicolinate reductase [bacterium]|nr:4-hydroxy-tetrahydrodipicolinate reductase [bacterium]
MTFELEHETPEKPILRAAVCGAAGRMGRMLVEYLAGNPGFELVGATEHAAHADIGKDVGTALFGRAIDVALEPDLRVAGMGANAVIDFTHPEASLAHARICADAGLPFVCGTTGMSPAQLAEFREIAARTRTVFASNFSTGVTLLNALAFRAARALGEDFDVEIVETHHRHKADAPSGTALTLARSVARAIGVDEGAYVHGREGVVGARPGGQIGLHAVRGGDVVGEHEVQFLGEGEQIMLRHRATSRLTFVRGAIRAALWLQKQEPGIHDMRDVLGLS